MVELFLRAVAGRILYLALHLESSSFPQPLSPEQEREAFAALAAGDPAARDRIIRHNLRLVAHIAKKYYAGSADPDDLVSIGTIGLIKAVGSFDAARASRFSTYASRCIENELRMQFRHQRRDPPLVSLQEPLETGGSGGLSLVDVIPDDSAMEEDVEHRETGQRLRRRLAALPAREARVLCLRFGLLGSDRLTQQQVAKRLGISRSYVSRLESKALAQMKKIFEKERP